MNKEAKNKNKDNKIHLYVRSSWANNFSKKKLGQIS